MRNSSMETLTLRDIRVRTVVVPVRRPVLAKVGTFNEVPLILREDEDKVLWLFKRRIYPELDPKPVR